MKQVENASLTRLLSMSSFALLSHDGFPCLQDPEMGGMSEVAMTRTSIWRAFAASPTWTPGERGQQPTIAESLSQQGKHLCSSRLFCFFSLAKWYMN